MSTCLVHASKTSRIALILVLTWLSSAWTCSVFLGFHSCLESLPQPQIIALLPDTISEDEAPVLLTVDGSGFVSQSEILWNGHPLQTMFMDSGLLKTTITQRTFESFGGSAGNSVLISVMSPESDLGCSGSSSGTVVLLIN
jgi:hypothetical protein